MRIHASQSFCFRTKERVPYFVCFEVADYATPEGVRYVVGNPLVRRTRRHVADTLLPRRCRTACKPPRQLQSGPPSGVFGTNVEKNDVATEQPPSVTDRVCQASAGGIR